MLIDDNVCCGSFERQVRNKVNNSMKIKIKIPGRVAAFEDPRMRITLFSKTGYGYCICFAEAKRRRSTMSTSPLDSMINVQTLKTDIFKSNLTIRDTGGSFK